MLPDRSPSCEPPYKLLLVYLYLNPARSVVEAACSGEAFKLSLVPAAKMLRAVDMGSATLPGNRYGQLNQDHAVISPALTGVCVCARARGCVCSSGDVAAKTLAEAQPPARTRRTTKKRSPRACTPTRSSPRSRAPSRR